MMLPAFLVAASAVVTSFNSPSGTLIVDLAVVIKDGWTMNESVPWNLDLSDVSGVVIDTVEFHPDLPGFVLESLNKTEKASFSYKLDAFVCRHSECRKVTYTGNYHR